MCVYDIPLVYAAINGSEEVACYILEHFPEQAQWNGKITPLRAAVFSSSNNIIAHLIQCGAIPDNDCLGAAMLTGNKEAVILFLKCKKFKPSSFGDLTPVQFAALNNENEILEFLLVNGYPYNELNKKGYNALHIACFLGHIDCALTILSFYRDLKEGDGIVHLKFIVHLSIGLLRLNRLY